MPSLPVRSPAFRRPLVAASVAAFLLSSSAPLRADWIGATTGSGTSSHSYNNTTNWAGGVIDDSFSGLTLTGSTTLHLTGSRTTGASGLNLQTAASNFTFAIEGDGTDPYVLTLGGNVSVAGGLFKRIGSTTNASRGLPVNLGGATRTFTIASGSALTLANTVSNGGIVVAGGGDLAILSATTFNTTHVTVAAGSFSLNRLGTSVVMSGFTPLQIGTTGTASMTLDGGAVLNTVSNGAVVGSAATGTVAMDSAGTSWIDGGLIIGNTGIGSVRVGGGSTGSTALLRLGLGAAGTLTVDGTGSAYTVTGGANATRVGESNSGTINITAGGTFSAGASGDQPANIAVNAGSTGTLRIGNGGASGTLLASSVAFGAGSGQLLFNHTDAAYVFAPPVTGTAGTVLLGFSGTTRFTGASTFTGTTIVANPATMQIGNGGTVGSWAADITNNSIVTFNRSDSHTYAGAITGTGSGQQSGTGTLTLSGTNSFGGGFQVTAGTLSVTGDMTSSGAGTVVAAGASLNIGGNGATGSHTGSINLAAGNAGLFFNRSGSLVHGGIISGTGPVAVIGTGTVTLTATNTHTGAMSVGGGTLLVNGSLAAGSAVGVSLTGTLGGTGTIHGSVTTILGGRIAPGASIGTLTVDGNVAWSGSTNGSATLLYELSNTSATSDLLAIGGAFTKNPGSTYRFDFGDTGQAGRTYTLVTFGSTTFAVGDFSYTNLASGLTGSFSIVGNELRFTTAAANAAPVATASGGATAYTENAAPLAIDSALTVTDSDNANLTSGSVAITGNFQSAEDVLAFTNSGGISGSYNASTGVLTLTGSASLATWQTALRSVTYANSSENPNTTARTISFVVSDGTSNSTTTGKSVTITAVNDAPVVTAPATIAVTEDTVAALTGISFSDADAGASSVTATLTVGSGSIAAVAGGGVTVGGTATARTLTGTIAALNAFIAGSNVAFTPALDDTSNVTLTVSLNDGGNTGGGGAQTGSATTTLTLSAVNDAPTITAPATINFSEDISAALTGITLADVDLGNVARSVSFIVASGDLIGSGGNTFVGPNTGGVTAAAGSGLGSRTLTGTLADINAYLAAGHLIYRPVANASGNVNLLVRFDDNGGTGSGGVLQASANITLAIAAVNDAPVNTLPAAQTMLQNSSLVLSTANGNRISIADVDAGSATMRITLTATGGQVTINPGPLVADGGANGTATASYLGSIADINAALDGLIFSSTFGFAGNATLQIVTSDLGNTGGGGGLGVVLTDTDTLTIAVGGVPVLTTAGSITWTESLVPGPNAVPVASTLTVADSDSTTLASASVAITANFVASEDSLSFIYLDPVSHGNIAASYDAPTGVLTLTSAGATATLAQWQAALRSVVYSNSSTAPTIGTRTMTFRASDGTNTSAPVTQDVGIVSINNPPINTLPVAQSVAYNGALTLSTATGNRLSIADADARTSALAIFLTATNGTVTLGGLADIAFITGDGTADATMTFIGTVTALNNALNGLVFRPTPNFSGTASLQIVTNDQGNTGPDGIKTDTDTLTITVAAPSPPPPALLAQTITFAPVSVQLGQSVALNATASSGLPVAFSIASGTGTLAGNQFTPTSLAPVTIRASQGGNATYSSAFAEQTVTPAGKFTQSIVFNAPADRPANAPAFALDARASSGLGVTYTIVSGPALLSGNTITLTGAPGIVVIRATQDGNASYEAAASVTRSFNVTPVAVLVFFGTTNRGDDLAATLTLDRTSGRAIGYLRETGEAFVLPFRPTGVPGNYEGTGRLLTATAAPRSFRATLRANETGDVLTGEVVGGGLTFSVTIQPQIGPNASVAGGYHAPLLNTAAGETHAVASAPGRVYYLAASPGLTGGGFGTLDGSHTFSVTTTPASTVSGAIDPNTTMVTGIYTPPGRGASAFAGLNIATLRTDRLVNLSSRDRVGAGSRTLIAGFVIAGEGLKNVLVRASGPALRPFGISGTLANPRLILYRDGRVVHDNDDWPQSPNPADIVNGGVRVGAFALANGSLDAAIADSLAPGAYTAQVVDSTSEGVALAEIYDAALNPSSEYQRLVNISSRGESSPGEGVLIGGFVIAGNFPKRVLVRGIGPGLSAFGVQGVLADPGLRLFNSVGIAIGANDNWETPQTANAVQTAATAAEIAAAGAQCGAFALLPGARDASLILTLAPGAYTAHVAGANNTTGVALVEIYEIPE